MIFKVLSFNTHHFSTVSKIKQQPGERKTKLPLEKKPVVKSKSRWRSPAFLMDWTGKWAEQRTSRAEFEKISLMQKPNKSRSAVDPVTDTETDIDQF